MSFDMRPRLNRWFFLSLGLIGIYCGVLFMALHPRVSDAYRAYFIDRSSDIPPAWIDDPRYEPAPLSVNRLYAHTESAFRLFGWHDAEPGQTWSRGKQASILVTLPAGLGAGRELVLAGLYLNGRQRVGITIGSTYFSRVHESGEPIRIPLPETQDRPETIAITLRFPDATRPGNGDARVLAFALQSLQLR